MNELLCERYDKLYITLVLSKHCLIDALDKPERKLLLTIMDRKDEIADELAFDSFVCGFKLALQFSAELSLNEETPLDRSKNFDDSVVSVMFGDNQTMDGCFFVFGKNHSLMALAGILLGFFATNIGVFQRHAATLTHKLSRRAKQCVDRNVKQL